MGRCYASVTPWRFAVKHGRAVTRHGFTGDAVSKRRQRRAKFSNHQLDAFASHDQVICAFRVFALRPLFARIGWAVRFNPSAVFSGLLPVRAPDNVMTHRASFGSVGLRRAVYLPASRADGMGGEWRGSSFKHCFVSAFGAGHAYC